MNKPEHSDTNTNSVPKALEKKKMFRSIFLYQGKYAGKVGGSIFYNADSKEEAEKQSTKLFIESIKQYGYKYCQFKVETWLSSEQEYTEYLQKAKNRLYSGLMN